MNVQRRTHALLYHLLHPHLSLMTIQQPSLRKNTALLLIINQLLHHLYLLLETFLNQLAQLLHILRQFHKTHLLIMHPVENKTIVDAGKENFVTTLLENRTLLTVALTKTVKGHQNVFNVTTPLVKSTLHQKL